MSNIDPELATKQNLQKAAKNAAGTSKTGKAVAKAKDIAKAVDTIYAKSGIGKTTANTKGLNASERAAVKIFAKAMNDKSNKNAVDIMKAAQKAAKKKVEKAEKANSVSVGKGTDKYTLPNVNLSKPINFDKYSTLPGQSAALQALMKTRESAPATNPNTASYIRPDAGYATGGAVDTSRAANTGFSDNLAAFRRV